MLARVHKELTIVKDCSVADVAVLGWIDRDVSVLLMPSLRPQELRVLRMLLDLSPEIFDLFFVVIKTIAKMFLHVFDFSLLREEIEQVFDFEHIVLSNDDESLLHFDLLTLGVWNLRSEQMLGNLHPKLFARLATCWLVSIVASHVSVIDLESFLDSFRVQVQDSVENDLRLLNHHDMVSLSLIVIVVKLGFKLLDFSLAHIDCVIDLKKDRLTLLLVGFLPLKMLD